MNIQEHAGDAIEAGSEQENRKASESVCFPRLIEVDPIGIEPTTSTLPVCSLPMVSSDETRGESGDAVLVRPNVRPSEQEADALTAELLAIWSQLDDQQRLAVIEDFRTRFTGDHGRK